MSGLLLGTPVIESKDLPQVKLKIDFPVPLGMEKASEVYLHSKRNDAMDNENIILSLSEKIIEGVKSEENQHYFYSIFFGQNF